MAAELIHVLKLERIYFHHSFRKQESSGTVRHLIQALNEPKGKFRKLHHGAGDVAQQHQMFALGPFFPVAQPVEAAAGFQTLADGFTEVQLAGVGAAFALGREFSVDLPGHRLDHSDRFGNFRILKLRNIPVQDAHFRVNLLGAHSGIFHQHLLLQNSPGKYRVDKFAVEFGIALCGTPVFFHKAAQSLTGILRHGGIGFPLAFVQVHRLAVELQVLFCLLAVLLHLLLPLHLLLGLLAHLFFRDEKSVKAPVKGKLLFPGFGIDRPQGSFHLFPVCHPQANQQPGSILGFLGTDD